MSASPAFQVSGARLPVAARRIVVGAWPAALAALAAFALALGWLLFVRTPFIPAGDDAMYVILARALATGQGFRFLNLPGAPAATHFPPGYPALLAFLWRLAPAFPANVALFKSVNAIALAVIAVGTARLARAVDLPDRWALALGIVVAASGPMLILGNMLLSELVFLAMLLLLLPALEQFVAARSGSATRAILLGAAIGACVLVRTHGIVLLPAAVAVLAVRRRWRSAAILTTVSVACLLPWQLWSARHAGALPAPLLGQYDSYLSWWVRGYRAIGPRMVSLTLGRTIAEGAGMFAVLFSPSRGAAGHALTLAALGAMATIGIVAVWRRIPVTLLFLGGYLAIVALWPFQPARFIWGVWPLLLLLLTVGARSSGRMVSRWRTLRPGRRMLAIAAVGAALWTASGYAAYEMRTLRGRWWMSIPRANAARIVPAVRWILANTAPSDLLAAEDDGALFLYTGRRTLPVRTFVVQQYLYPISPRVEAEQGLIPLLAAYPIRVVVVGSPMTVATAQWAASMPIPLLSLREQFAGGAAFTVLPR